MKELIVKLEKLDTRADFIEFVGLLLSDLTTNSDSWENKNLSSYLEAVAAWTEDMDGYFKYNNLPLPKEDVDWKLFATILIAAKTYE